MSLVQVTQPVSGGSRIWTWVILQRHRENVLPGPGQGQHIPPLLLQLVGQVYLLLPHALHQQPGPLQLLLCFCNILGPQQGQNRVSLLLGTGGQVGEGWKVAGVVQGVRPGTLATPTPLPALGELGLWA